jgi:predicted DNA-binding transcriptional regulator AlpA
MARKPNINAVVRAIGDAMPRNPNLGASPRAVVIPSPVVTDYMRARVKAAGGDPASVPDMPYKFMRPADVVAILGVSIATFYRMIGDGIFPRPIPVDRAASRAAAAPGNPTKVPQPSVGAQAARMTPGESGGRNS